MPYSYWLMVLGGAGWDKKESPESNLYVCGKDDTKIAIYNLEKCIEKADWNSYTISVLKKTI